MAFLVAHRGGNDLARLRECELLGIRLVECDVRLWRKTLEVTHLRAVGRLPIHWEKWRLGNPLAPRLRLADVLAAAGPDTELMLDLKGVDPRLTELVVPLLPPDRRVSVCSRSWALLEPFLELDHVRVVYSVGTPRELDALLALPDSEPLDGVSIHERLLDPATVAALRERTALILAWPVGTAKRARELVALGVDGVITQDLKLAFHEPGLVAGRR